MPAIAVMPDALVSQVAAGEVVEDDGEAYLKSVAALEEAKVI